MIINLLNLKFSLNIMIFVMHMKDQKYFLKLHQNLIQLLKFIFLTIIMDINLVNKYYFILKVIDHLLQKLLVMILNQILFINIKI